MLATRLRYVSEDSKKMGNNLLIEMSKICLTKYFIYLKNVLKMGAKKCLDTNVENKYCVKGLCPHKHLGLWGASPPTSGSAPRPWMLLDSIPLANWLLVKTLVSVFESGLQKSVNPIKILSAK